MKKIFLSLLAIVLYSGSLSAQTLMSDEEHRIMMNDFAIQLNNTLTYNCPQGVTVDQYKRGIVDGTYTLSQMMQDNLIINFTQALKDYGSQFAAAKGLTANTDALKYFYSTFAPSTAVQNGQLVESTTSAGLTATEMWTCALNTFGTNNCGSSVLVSDKNNLSILATTSVNKLTAVAGNIGMLVMLNGFGDCIMVVSIVNNICSVNKFMDINKDLIIQNIDAINQLDDDNALISFLSSNGFQNVGMIQNEISNFKPNCNRISKIITFEKEFYNSDSYEDTPIGIVLNKYIRLPFETTLPVNDLKRTCWEQYQVDLSRCRRNYRRDLKFLIVLTAFSGPAAPVTGGLGLIQFGWEFDDCREDAWDDYLDCN